MELLSAHKKIGVKQKPNPIISSIQRHDTTKGL